MRRHKGPSANRHKPNSTNAPSSAMQRIPTFETQFTKERGRERKEPTARSVVISHHDSAQGFRPCGSGWCSAEPVQAPAKQAQHLAGDTTAPPCVIV